MKITKQNEIFNVADTTEVYETSGSVSREADGSLNIYFFVSYVNGERVGDIHYTKYPNSEFIDFGVNCTEANRDELITYSDSLIDSVLAYFKSDI